MGISGLIGAGFVEGTRDFREEQRLLREQQLRELAAKLEQEMRRQQMAMQREQMDMQRENQQFQREDRLAAKAEKQRLFDLAELQRIDEQNTWRTNRNVGMDAANVLNMPGMSKPDQAREINMSRLRNQGTLTPQQSAAMQQTIEMLTARDPIADHEAKARIDAKYRAPSRPDEPKMQWVYDPSGGVNGGKPFEVQVGKAPPNTQVYTGVMSRDDAKEIVSDEKKLEYINDAEAALAELKGTPGQAGATGVPALNDPGSWQRLLGMDAAAGSPAAVYDAKRRMVISRLVAPRLEILRGLGQMSNMEFGNMVAGTTSMGEGRLSEEAEQKELSRLTDFLAEAKQVLLGRGVSQGITVVTPPPSGSGAKTNGEGSFEVTAPDGVNYRFKTKEAADTFRRRIGGR